MRNYRIYTEPTLVQPIAAQLRNCDSLAVTLEGTQHVYVTAEDSAIVLEMIGRGRGWTMRDIQQLPD